MNWSVLLVGLFALAIACMAALRVARADVALASAGVTSPVVPALPRRELVGLGGWLILVAFGVTLAPLRLLFTIWRTLPSYAAGTWAQLTTPGRTSYHPLWAPVLLFELLGNVALFVFTCLLIYLFYKRKKQFPIVFIWVSSASVLLVLLDHLFIQILPGDATSLNWASVIPPLIWIVYMLRSRRVRNTFIN